MSNKRQGSKFMRIQEAAEFLGVHPRTVYRRIKKGELPASKVGGLYLINRETLDALLAQGSQGEREMIPESKDVSSLLKCGYCHRIIESETNIGGECPEPDCDEVICTRCWLEGVHHCERHAPTRQQKWEAAQTQQQNGEISLLVRSSAARLQEINFLNRMRGRLSVFNTLIHPASGELLTVSDWGAILHEDDQRAEVMRLMGRVALEADMLSKVPLNASLTYRISGEKAQTTPQLVILVAVLSRLAEMLRDGFDTLPMGEEELLPHLVEAAELAGREDAFHMLLLASTTGWDAGARALVQGKPSAGAAFTHPGLLVYLFDLQQGELLYNNSDERAFRYADLFTPLLPEEELEDVIEAVEKQLLAHESLTLVYALDALPYPQRLIEAAFKKMEASGKYSLVEVPELGMAIVRG